MKKLSILIITVLMFTVGCTPTRTTIFYWGNYSSALYKYKKTPDESTRAAYKSALKEILDNAKKKFKKIPPGVHAEYGYVLAQEGDIVGGQEYFGKELQLYPESKEFVAKLQQEISRGNQQ
ncbi:DUF4810 domain-containing protein [bacterium]|nr:DUF4810 domain-containing protein [bacterium]NUN44854.1 DUF4810 domain-containing protein [bacterium]